MTMPDFSAPFNPSEAVRETLDDFDSVAVLGVGAVLYPRRWGVTELPRNLHASMVAASLGLASLDYARRAYTTERRDDEDVSAGLFAQAFSAAMMLMARTRANVLPDPDPDETHFGPFAAAVALQRLDSGFRAAHLLYSLGLNIEGDAVARQVLEQIAWAVKAGRLRTLVEIERVQSQASVGALTNLVPEMGRLYGELSGTAHAKLRDHRGLVVQSGGTGETVHVLLSWSNYERAANVLLSLADAWSIVYEVTQADLMVTFESLGSRDDLEPNPARSLVAERATLIEALRRAAGEQRPY